MNIQPICTLLNSTINAHVSFNSFTFKRELYARKSTQLCDVYSYGSFHLQPGSHLALSLLSTASPFVGRRLGSDMPIEIGDGIASRDNQR